MGKVESKNPLFPNGEEDILVEITDVKITTNFSYMGETDGIDMTCSVVFKTKYEEILMHPDWENGKPTENLKQSFPNGYYVFQEFKKEKVYYRFFIDYDKEQETFSLKTVKKKEEPNCYYLNSVQERYTEDSISQFEHQLYQKLLRHYVKKVSYDKKSETE